MAKSPNKLRPRINLAANYQARGRLNLAIAQYEKLLRLCETKDEIQMSDKREVSLCDSVRTNLAAIMMDHGQPQAGEVLLIQAVNGKPPDAAFINLAVVRMRQGRLNEAMDLLNTAASFPAGHTPEIDINIAQILLGIGKCKESIPYYQNVNRFYPQVPIPTC